MTTTHIYVKMVSKSNRHVIFTQIGILKKLLPKYRSDITQNIGLAAILDLLGMTAILDFFQKQFLLKVKTYNSVYTQTIVDLNIEP